MIYTSKQLELFRQVVHDLETDEGFREWAYPDPLSKLAKTTRHLPWGFKPAREIAPVGTQWEQGNPWTVGHGFTNGVTPDSHMTLLQSRRKLEDAMAEADGAYRQVFASWYADTSFATKTVLLNMYHQLGLKGVLGFKNTLAYIKAKMFDKAANGMRSSLWHRQTPRRVDKYAKRIETQTIAAEDVAPEMN